jgi:hypothetical protein
MNYNNLIYFPLLHSTYLDDRIIFPEMCRKNFVEEFHKNSYLEI